MKILLLSIAIILSTRTLKLDESVILTNDDNDFEIREPVSRELDSSSNSIDDSGVNDEMSENIQQYEETVDNKYDNTPDFKLDSQSMEDKDELKGEIEEMKNLRGKDVLKTVPNALHHHVVFPWSFPYVGMKNHHDNDTEAVEPVEE